MGGGHDHGTSEIRHERPLWWAFGLIAVFFVVEVVGVQITTPRIVRRIAVPVERPRSIPNQMHPATTGR